MTPYLFNYLLKTNEAARMLFCEYTILCMFIGDIIASSIFAIYLIIYTHVFTIHWQVKTWRGFYAYIKLFMAFVFHFCGFPLPTSLSAALCLQPVFLSIWMQAEVCPTTVFNVPQSLVGSLISFLTTDYSKNFQNH